MKKFAIFLLVLVIAPISQANTMNGNLMYHGGDDELDPENVGFGNATYTFPQRRTHNQEHSSTNNPSDQQFTDYIAVIVSLGIAIVAIFFIQRLGRK